MRSSSKTSMGSEGSPEPARSSGFPDKIFEVRIGPGGSESRPEAGRRPQEPCGPLHQARCLHDEQRA
jgi:hypothetical protein